MANGQAPLYAPQAHAWQNDPRSNPEWFYDRIKHLTMGELANLARTLPQFAPQLGLSQDEVWNYLDIINRVSGGQVSPYTQAAAPAAGPQGGALPGTQTAPPVQPVQPATMAPTAPTIPVDRTNLGRTPSLTDLGGQGRHGKRPTRPGAIAGAIPPPSYLPRPSTPSPGGPPGYTGGAGPGGPDPSYRPPASATQPPAVPPPQPVPAPAPTPRGDEKRVDYAGMSMEDFMKNGEVFYISINGHGLRRDEGGQFVPTR